MHILPTFRRRGVRIDQATHEAPAREPAILSVNVGSSSLKFAAYALSPDGRVVPTDLRGQFEGLESSGRSALGSGTAFEKALISLQARVLEEASTLDLRAVAHRVVHGGGVFTQAVKVTSQVRATLATYACLAPLHQAHNLAGIDALAQAFPHVPQIACFDTAFHAHQPELERRFALPESFYEQGIRRYGFHGLAYQSVMQALQGHSARASQRVLMAHLGSGASLCGAWQGQSQTSTMGFSALDGLMMGTRCGALDPGVLLSLMAQGWDHARLEHLLYQESGLLGVSGVSADMRRLRADPSPAAQRAIDLFVHRVVRECGAVVASLQGLDVLAFSGGIGEHDAVLRAQVCEALAYLGVDMDPARNQAAVGDAVQAIHRPASRVEIWLIPADEDRVMAQAAAACLNSHQA